MSNTHGNPLNITLGRFKLIASRNNSSMKDQAINILATLEGKITPSEPRGNDEITVKLARIKVPAPQEAKYVERKRTKRRSTQKD